MISSIFRTLQLEAGAFCGCSGHPRLPINAAADRFRSTIPDTADPKTWRNGLLSASIRYERVSDWPTVSRDDAAGDPMPTMLSVGGLYDPNRTSYPEQTSLRIVRTGVELLLLFGAPTSEEIEAVGTGPAEFAWIDRAETAMLGFRFGKSPWSVTPYTPHREPEHDIVGLPAVDPGTHLLVRIFLVDAATGLIRAISVTSWPPRFVDHVRASLDRMLAEPFDQASSDAELDALYARYPDNTTLVRERAAITCTGGRD